MGKLTNMTVKGQVTVPKDVRDALGLKAGEPVEFIWNEAGQAVIQKPARLAASDEVRRERLARIDAFAARFAHLPPEDTDAYMAELREPLPDSDPAHL